MLGAMGRLPIELWSIIFEFASLGDDLADLAILSLSDAPLSLTQVCSSWRKMAISLPRLWSQVDLDYDDAAVSANGYQFADLWLSRARERPIDVATNHTMPLGHLCQNWSKRIRTLVAMIPEPVDCLDFSPSNKGFPMLERLEFSIHCSPTDIEGLCESLSRSPRLENVTWDVHYLSAEAKRPMFETLPWSQLKTMDMYGFIRMDDAIASLALGINLVELSLEIEDTVERFGLGQATSVLPHLKSLTLKGPTTCGALFQSITTPALETLVFDPFLGRDDPPPGQDVSWKHAPFMDFLARSQPPISHLRFASIHHLSESNIIDILRLVEPTLEVFRLIYSKHLDGYHPIGDATMAEWVCTPTHVSFPKLNSACLPWSVSTTPGVFADMVESRVQYGSRFRYLGVAFRNTNDNTVDVERISKLTQERPDLDIKTFLWDDVRDPDCAGF